MPNWPLGSSAPDISQIFSALQNVVTALNSLQGTVSKIFPLGLSSSATWTPGAITAGSQATKVVTCANTALGMSAQAAFSLDIQDLTISAYVNAAGSVTVVLFNGTSGTVTLGAGTISVWARSN